MTARSHRLLALVVVVLATAVPASAADDNSTPFAGAQLLHRTTSSQDFWLLQVDLCTPGVAVRGTRPSEKGRTVSSFSNLVGAAAAINGDFFNGSFGTDGPSMGDGEGWGGADHGYVTPVQFGPGTVLMPHHSDGAGVQAGITQVVAGHPTLLDDNNEVGNPGDSLCTARHPRTALGLSADQRTLMLLVVDGRRTGAAGMTCPELVQVFREFGATDAVNLDGGGSSTLVTGGAVRNRPSGGSQRTVGNHLAILQSGGGDAPFCPGSAPEGFLDSAACDAVEGWARDADNSDAPVTVELDFDGHVVTTVADVHRDDLCSAIGSCAHGFSVPVPAGFRDDTTRTVRATARDLTSGQRTALGALEYTCAPPPPPRDVVTGFLRHVPDPAAFDAWRFSTADIARATPELLATYDVGAPWPGSHRLVKSADDPNVYLVEGSLDGTGPRRHVPSPAAMAAWRLDFGAVEVLAAADLDAIVEGDPLPAAPFLLRADGPEVYVLDERPRPPGAGEGEGEGEGPIGEGEGEGETLDLPPSVTSGCAQGDLSLWGLAAGAALLARRRRRHIKMTA